MHIRKLKLNNVFKHSNTELVFPDTGLVLISGSNGSGKSSSYDSVSAALWGKTLRGTPAWRKDGTPGSIEVTLDDYTIVRSKPKSGPVTLSYGKDLDSMKDFGTASKAQSELDAIIGDWTTWSKTCVFEADALGAFTKATDAQRKRLIEDLTDSDRFDPALKKARDEKKEVASKIVAIERKVAVLKERKSNLTDRLNDLSEAVEDIEVPDVDPEKLQKKVDRLNKLIDSTSKDIKALNKKLDRLDVEASNAQGDLRVAKQEASRLDADNCPTCNQSIPEDFRNELRSKVNKAKKVIDDKNKEHQELREELEEELEDLEDTLVGLRKKERTVSNEVYEAKSAQKQASRIKEELAKREGQVSKCKEDLDSAKKELRNLTSELKSLISDKKEIEVCEKILGVQGVRAHIIGEALGGIEQITNIWLSRIGWEGLQVKLRPYSEKSNSDALSDKISLKIEGCGDGYGYDAASRGEHRRIDVAFMFAFGEFASAAQGTKPGTLWMDETFDGLDDAGIEAVADAIYDLSKERVIVVITHRQDLVNVLNPKAHWHVKDGKVIEVGSSSVKEH